MQSLDVSLGVRAAATLRPDKTALVEADRRLSYAQLVSRMNRVAVLASEGLGVQAGRRTAILAPSCLEYVELLLGLSSAGTPAVLLNTRLSAPELQAICEDADVAVVFVHPSLRGLAEAMRLPPSCRMVTLGADYEGLLADARDARPQRPFHNEDLLCQPYTGGTTGKAKGVMLTHRCRAQMYLMMGAAFGCYRSTDVNLTVSPLFHGAGFNFCLATLYHGGCVVLAPRFDPEEVLGLFRSHRVTNASVVPTHLTSLFALGDARLANGAFASMKALISNGAALPQSQRELARNIWGPVLFDAYGGTEAGVVATLAPAQMDARPGSVGEVFCGTDIRLLNDAGVEVAAGEIGEVFTRSPYLFSGYWGDSADSAIKDGWFSAGDMARLDADGFMYLADRRGEKIITGGLNVYPSEVELVLADHPAVAEAAVFGVADSHWGEAVHALVSLMPGTVATEAELREYAGARLGRYKVPKRVEFLNSLPKSAAGKVLRRELRDEYRKRSEGNA